MKAKRMPKWNGKFSPSFRSVIITAVCIICVGKLESLAILSKAVYYWDFNFKRTTVYTCFEITTNFMKLKLKTQHCNLISHQNAANRFPNFSKYMQLQAIAVWPAYLVMHRTIKISPTLAAGYIPNQQQSSLFMRVAQRWSVRKHGKKSQTQNKGDQKDHLDWLSLGIRN